MKKINIPIVIILSVIIISIGIAVGLSGGEKSATASGEVITNRAHETKMRNMDLMDTLSERDFIENMIPHHEEAIDTAQETLARGATTPEVKLLLQNITEAQIEEVENMKEWYKEWYGVEYADTGTYQPMMRNLERLSGVNIDRTFLEDMIHHHMGAIMMANAVQKYIEHDDTRILTENIRVTQTQEISEMRQLLREI